MNRIAFALAALSLVAAPVLAQGGSDELRRREIEARLGNQTIPLILFDGETLDESIDLISQYTGMQLVRAPNLWDEHDPGEEVHLRLTNVTVRTALRLLLEPRDLTITYRDGMIQVVPKADVRGHMATRRYDVQDLTYAPPDFPGPTVALVPPDSYGSGSGISGALFDLGDDSAGAYDSGVIEDLIRQHTGGGEDGWGEAEDAGANITAIESLDGSTRYLIITQTEGVHVEIRDLLALLRQFK